MLDLPNPIQTTYNGMTLVARGFSGLLSPIKTNIGFKRAEISVKENEIKIKGSGACSTNQSV